MFRHRVLPAAGLSLVLLAIAAAALVLTSQNSDAGSAATIGPALPQQVAAADRLTTLPEVAPSSSSPTHQTESDLRATSLHLGAGVPVPPGGSLGRIDWAAAAAQGGDSEAGMRGVIEYQAACQWYAYALNNNAPTDALKVISAIPNWPTFRANPTNAQLSARTMQTAFANGDLASVKTFVDTNCR